MLDEGIPHRLARRLRETGVDAATLPEEWRGISDAYLHDLAEANGYAALITQDRNMPFQSPLKGRSLAVLIVPQLDRQEVLRRMDAIAAQLLDLEPGRYAVLGHSDSLPDNPTKPLSR